MRLRLRLAAFLDRWESRVRRVVERVHPDPAWLAEFSAYLGDTRLTIEEFWVRYTLRRISEGTRMQLVDGEAAARAFYETSDYPLWRGVVHRRHTAWRRVLWTMPHRGVLLEFGCGIAPVTAWCARRKPQWTYLLEDLDGPALRYGLWRERRALGHTTAHYFGLVDVLTALDVLEHLLDPLATARDLVGRLKPGGTLHFSFPETDGRELDLATAEQRDATIRYLEAALVSVYDRDGYRVSVKR